MSGKKDLDASFGMAFVDALPVLFFCIAMVLIALIYKSWIFAVGALLCVLAGAGKVVWKLILAASRRNVFLLNRQFRFLMPAGFILMIISLFVKRPSLRVIWMNVSAFPCCILFIVGIAGLVVMGILAGKLDSSDKKANWIEQLVNTAAQLCILLGVFAIWMANR